jgi:SNF2 family DNA or RNA helicase
MTPRPYTPRAYATLGEQFIAGNRRCNLYAGMGLGKTVITLTYLEKCYRVWGDDAPTLVLGPRRVVASTWPDESRKWQHLNALDIAVAVGEPAERAAALRRDVPIVCMNYDNLPWLREELKRQGRAWPFRRVVADESTRLKNFRTKQGGARAKVLGEVAHTAVDEWINLTGTPAPNGLRDLWGQQWFVDAGLRLGRTYAAFESRWFGFVRARDAASGRMDIQPVIFPYSQAQIQERMADCTLTIDPHDYFDLRAPIVNVIEVELPSAVRRQYRELEREMFVRLATGDEVEALNAAALSMKCLQFANGAVYLVAGSDVSVEVHDAKLEALESIVEEAGGAPVLVAYHFKSDLARLQRAFPAGRHLDADPRTIDEWNAGRIPVLFAHPASAGHGLNLQDGGNTLVFYSQWWDLEQHDQIVERIGPVRQMQAGHDRPVFIHYIVARDTVDELVMLRRESKRSVQSILLEAMKARA